ncbi:MAG: hypothetical protein GC164_05955 [Phycisphaera sp.]|nr:hypothetical protein [Phycisphaera sp.]
MNTQRLILIVALLAVLGALAVVMGVMGGGGVDQKTLEQWTAQLDDRDPQVRLDAARSILDIQHNDRKARLTAATSLIALRRFADARDQLDMLADRRGTGDTQVLRLLCESYLDEARLWSDSSSRGSLDLLEAEVEDHMDEAEPMLALLDRLPGQASVVKLLRARQADIRATLLVNKRRFNITALADAHHDNLTDQIQDFGVSSVDIRSRLAQLNQQIGELCKEIDPAVDPDHTALELLFRVKMRERDIDGARAVARSLLELPHVGRSLVGKISTQLFDMERDIAVSVDAQDLDLVEKLLNRPGLEGDENLVYSLASARLAMAQGRGAQALQQSDAILEKYVDNPGAASIKAQALTATGQAREAVLFLVPLTERLRAGELFYDLAVAYLAQDRREDAVAAFRKCLETYQDHLPARIALAETMLDLGQNIEAQPEIRMAVAINEQHPGVRQLEMRALLMTLDAQGTHNLLSRVADLPATPTTQDEAAMVSMMVLDDVAGLSELLSEHPDRGRDALRWAARAWAKQPAKTRMPSGWMLAREWATLALSDPMARFAPVHPMPKIKPENESPAQTLLASPFVDWPQSHALRLIDDLAQRQPIPDELSTLRDMLAACIAPPPSGPTLDPAGLTQHLAQHPWDSPAVLRMLSRPEVFDHPEASDAILRNIEPINPDVAALARGRLQLARLDAPGAVETLSTLRSRDVLGKELLLRVSDPIARARLSMGRADQAAGEFYNLIISLPHERLNLQRIAVDVMIHNGDTRDAVSSLAGLLTDSSATDDVLDDLLDRAAVLMSADRVLNLIDARLELVPKDAVLRLYRATILMSMDRNDEAYQAATLLLRDFPDSPRALCVAIDTAGKLGRYDEVNRWCRALADQGPGGRIAAQDKLRKWTPVNNTAGPANGPVAREPEGVAP